MVMHVQASGMVTAVGYNAPASLAAMRAGISGVRSPLWQDRESGEPFRCARVALPQRWSGAALLADLLAPAILECAQQARGVRLAEIPLLIGIAHPSRPGRPANLEATLPGILAQRLGTQLDKRSRLYANGQTGCAHALIDAHRLIHEGQARQVIVAGVDSLIDRDALEAFEQRRRLLTPLNFNGFLPGEAGAAVLIGETDLAGDALRVLGWGQAVEHATIESTQAMRAEALTQAAREALAAAGVSMQALSWRISDLSGEHYKFKEAMIVAMRLDRGDRAQPLEMWHPIEYLGEVGAAILPCALAWARHAMHEAYAPGPGALCHIGSDEGERAAFVLQGRLDHEGKWP